MVEPAVPVPDLRVVILYLIYLLPPVVVMVGDLHQDPVLVVQVDLEVVVTMKPVEAQETHHQLVRHKETMAAVE